MNHLLKILNLIVNRINQLMVILASIALACAALILSYSVVYRGLFNATTDWQDEAAVFCLVGVTFFTGAYVQEKRAHVGISAVAEILPNWLNKVRVLMTDFISFLFCTFFAWKSWTLWHEAWVEGQITSSSWGPPLSIPYGMMAAGMSLLAFQLLLQSLGHFFKTEEPAV